MPKSKALADTTAEKGRIDITDMYGRGSFQRMALFCGQLAGLVFVSHHLALPLLVRTVDHWCSPYPEYANLSTAEWKNVGIPVEQNGHHSQCLRYSPPLDVDAPNRSEEGCSDWSYDTQAKDDSILSEWDLVCQRAWLVPFQSVVFTGGSLLFTPVLGQTADRTGRRRVVVVAATVAFVAGFFALFAKTLSFYTLLRFLMAGCAGSVRLFSMVLLFELSIPERRTYYCSVVHVGTVLAQMWVNVLRNLKLNRRQVQANLMIPTYLLACVLYLAKESPRWLLSVGRFSETERLALWATHVNRRESLGAQQLRKRARIQRKPSNNEASFLDLLLSHTLWNRTVVMSLCWASLQLSASELYHALQRTASEGTSLLVGLLQPLTLVGSYALLTRWGRRPVFSCSLFVQGAIALSMGLSGFLEFSVLQNGLVVSAGCLTALTTITSYLYSMELFPTVLRCTGTSVVFMAGRIVGTVAASIVHLGLEEYGDVAIGLTGVVSLISGWLACRLPETQGAVLIETLAQMEAEARALSQSPGQ